MSAVHLYVVELERDGECGLQPIATVLAPHDHGVAELVGILVYNAVEFGLYHCRCAYNHVVVEKLTPALCCNLCGQPVVVVGELLDVVGVCNVARVDSALAVFDNHVDGYAVIFEEFALLGKQIKFLNLGRGLAYAPAEQSVEFNAVLSATFYDSAHVEGLG